jgi:N-acetylglucosaminyl-diphospho-decaprenol L-rhamnosyltransferase
MTTAGGARVAVVVVTHDSRDDVLACLASLTEARAHGGDPIDEVVVVDAGSRDGTDAAVHAAHPDVRILSVDNLGFGACANLGVAAAAADLVVVANADVRFAPDAVGRLVAGLEADASLGALGPLVRYPDGTVQASARSRPDALTAIAHGALGWIAPANRWTRRYRGADLDPHVAREADWLSGCALALRVEAFDAVGGFDPGYHLYVEDVDLCERLTAAGWRLMTRPDAVVVHRVGGATTRRPWRSRVAHARSLARYVATRPGRAGRLGRLTLPLLWVGLIAWVLVTGTVTRLRRGSVSPTGERRGERRLVEADPPSASRTGGAP